jgi:hypothetical protein
LIQWYVVSTHVPDHILQRWVYVVVALPVSLFTNRVRQLMVVIGNYCFEKPTMI